MDAAGPSQTPWTLDELSAQVRTALSSLPLAQKNGQVSEVPNGRTVRYYTTLGLLDRPRLEGRTAFYGPKHLARIVAIKRLQADGLALHEVQSALVGKSDDEIAALAALPSTAVTLSPPAESAEESFWSAPPAPALDDAASFAAAVFADARARRAPEAAEPAAHDVVGLTSAAGVTLSFPTTRALTSADREAVRTALASVTATLRARGLLGPTGDDR